MKKFAKICMFGLVACSLVAGMLGTASAGDTSAEERAAQLAFEKSLKSYDSVTWTSEQMQEGARMASLLSGEGNPFFGNPQPSANIRWTSDQLRAGAEYAAMLENEGSFDSALVAQLKARMKGSDNVSLANQATNEKKGDRVS